MANLSFGVKTGFDIYELVRTARFSLENSQAPIQSDYKIMTIVIIFLRNWRASNGLKNIPAKMSKLN